MYVFITPLFLKTGVFTNPLGAGIGDGRTEIVTFVLCWPEKFGHPVKIQFGGFQAEKLAIFFSLRFPPWIGSWTSCLRRVDHSEFWGSKLPSLKRSQQVKAPWTKWMGLEDGSCFYLLGIYTPSFRGKLAVSFRDCTLFFATVMHCPHPKVFVKPSLLRIGIFSDSKPPKIHGNLRVTPPQKIRPY